MFSDVLKELRAKTGVSQLKLAKAIGVSNGNVGDWERGRSKPGYDAIVALSRFFGVSSDSLLELSNLDDPISETCALTDVILELSNPHDKPIEYYASVEASKDSALTTANVDTSGSSVFSRIETLVKKRGLTLNRVERECGLGNGTIKRWENQSPRLDKLVSVARFLDVSLDFLVFGLSHPASSREPDLNMLKQEQGLNDEFVSLSEMESDLITMMRLLPAAQKKDLFDYVYFRYVQHVEQEKGSIYSTYFDDDSEINEGENGSSIA